MSQEEATSEQSSLIGLSPDVRARGDRAQADLYATPMQKRLRAEHAMFHAVVYWRPGCRDADELTAELRRIADTGFDAVRCHDFTVEYKSDGSLDYSITDAWFEAADRVGLRIILHLNDQREPGDRALDSVGLSRAEFDALPPQDRRYREALAVLLEPAVRRYRDADSLIAWAGFGEPGATELDLTSPEDGEQFAQWLRKRYDSVEELNAAWNIYPNTGPLVSSFDDAWTVARLPSGRTSINGASNARLNYGAQRDRYRFATDRNLERAAVAIDIIRDNDRDHPILTGSHQLFLNQPSLGWDIPRWGKLADMHFSSVHLSWHFEPVEGEIDRPVYFQARQTSDYFKGGWTSAYETTGGPVQYSGGFGNHMDAGLMRRLCLSYLAAGNQNLAFWTWNHRPGGWEGGEYGMISLSGRVTEWAREAGRIAKAAREHAPELWDGSPEPEVGLIQSWNTDAIQLLEPLRHDTNRGLSGLSSGTKLDHSRSWIGYSRALVNDHIAWNYLPEDELETDLVYSYPVIVAPFMRAISNETIERLTGYVHAGGVLIADLMFGYYDQWGKLRPTGEDGDVERLFGAWIDQVHDNRTGSRSIDGHHLPGFVGDLITTRGRSILHYEDGATAATVARHGGGAAVLMGFDPGSACAAPGAYGFEGIVQRIVRLFAARRYSCNIPLTYRLRAPGVDHYFIINEGVPRDAVISSHDMTYGTVTDVLNGNELSADPVLSVRIPERSGAWIRCEHEEFNEL